MYLESLPDNTTIKDIYRNWPDFYRPWMAMGRLLMNGESPLSEAEREMIGTYVSALNECRYCVKTHVPVIEKLGIDRSIVDQLLDDIDGAHVDDKLKPLLRFCKKLTDRPASINRRDAAAVLDAGWSEEALHTAVGVTCRYNYMNRLAMGLGLTPPGEDGA